MNEQQEAYELQHEYAEALSEIVARRAAVTTRHWTYRSTSNPKMDASDDPLPVWKIEALWPDGRVQSGPGMVKADAEFVVHAAADIDYLTTRLATVEAENERLRSEVCTCHYEPAGLRVAPFCPAHGPAYRTDADRFATVEAERDGLLVMIGRLSRLSASWERKHALRENRIRELRGRAATAIAERDEAIRERDALREALQGIIKHESWDCFAYFDYEGNCTTHNPYDPVRWCPICVAKAALATLTPPTEETT